MLVGDGESCAIDPGGPLATLGITERRYIRFHLDPDKQYFGATFVDLQGANELDRSIVCNLVEAKTTVVSP